MAKTADVQQAIWSDPWFHSLKPPGKLLYLWAITTQHGNLAGLFIVAEPIILAETGLTVTQFAKALEEVDGKIHYRHASGVMWIAGRAKHVRSKTTQIATSIARAVKECPDVEIRQAFVAKYGAHRWLSEVLSDEELELVRTTKAGIPNRVCAEVFRRDEFRCVDCGTENNLTIDHIRPESHGGSNKLDNLAIRCLQCNVKKGSALPSQMREPLIEVPSQSQSLSQSSKGKNPSTANSPKDAEWKDWLAHYRQATGRAVRTGSAEARSAFNARRSEGISLEDLKLATLGCHGDAYLRKQKLDQPETILRASNYRRYIELAKAAGKHVQAVEPVPDPTAILPGLPKLEEAWSEAVPTLQSHLGETSFSQWVQPLRPMGALDDKVFFTAPEHVRGWCEVRYLRTLAEALEPKLGKVQVAIIGASDAEAAA